MHKHIEVGQKRTAKVCFTTVHSCLASPEVSEFRKKQNELKKKKKATELNKSPCHMEKPERCFEPA